MTPKAAFEKMIDLNTKEMMFSIKIIDIDTEVSIEKIMVALVFKIDGGGNDIVITLMN